jgi:hypothetical protein
MERVARIELANKPWQGFRLPLHHTRIRTDYLSHYTPPVRESSLVGVLGFEPRTPWSQTRCASQTAPHSELTWYYMGNKRNSSWTVSLL